MDLANHLLVICITTRDNHSESPEMCCDQDHTLNTEFCRSPHVAAPCPAAAGM